MPEITPGIVTVERGDNGYLHVQIGRTRRVEQLSKLCSES